jgi:recombination protein RecA
MEKLKRRLKKEFGESKISMASETPRLDVVSTGSVGLDFATGVGGIPRGTVAEIFGAESMGKTTLAYYMIAEEQRKGKACAFINLEGQFSPSWAKKVAGVDTDKLILARPSHGEEAADMLLMMINEEDQGQHLSLVVFDSVGAMLSKSESEEDGKDRVGGQSKLVTGMVKRVLPAAAAHGVTVVFLNQIRDVMNATYGGVVESPGGHALKHAAVIRVQLKPGGKKYLGLVNGQKKEIGHRVTAVVKKNKAGAPKATASWDFIHDESEGRV